MILTLNTEITKGNRVFVGIWDRKSKVSSIILFIHSKNEKSVSIFYNPKFQIRSITVHVWFK